MAKAKKTDKQRVRRRGKAVTPLAPLSPHGKRMLERMVRTGRLTSYGRKVLESTEEGRHILAAGEDDKQPEHASAPVESKAADKTEAKGQELPAIDSLAVEIGKRLVEAREGLGLSQQNVHGASKRVDPAGEGVSRSALSLYETGVNRPGAREIVLLCEALKITPNWLLYGSDSPAKTLQASLDFLRGSDLEVAVRLAFALLALEREERDSFASLILSSVNKKLGDVELSGLMMMAILCQDALLKEILDVVGEENANRPISELLPIFVKKSAEGGWTPTGTLRPRFTKEEMDREDFESIPRPPRRLSQKK